jgi:hypothetical protein
MRYRRQLSTFVLPRVSTSLEAVPRVVGDSLSGRHPVPADLLTLECPFANQKSQVAGTEPELGRRLGERNKLPVQRPPELPLSEPTGQLYSNLATCLQHGP